MFPRLLASKSLSLNSQTRLGLHFLPVSDEFNTLETTFLEPHNLISRLKISLTVETTAFSGFFLANHYYYVYTKFTSLPDSENRSQSNFFIFLYLKKLDLL